MPSNLPGEGGGGWGLSRVWGLWGEKSPPKKSFQVSYFGGVFMMFPDGFDAFWALQAPIWVLDQPA